MMRVLSLPTALQFVVFGVGDRGWDAGFRGQDHQGVEGSARPLEASPPRGGSLGMVVSRDMNHPRGERTDTHDWRRKNEKQGFAL